MPPSYKLIISYLSALILLALATGILFTITAPPATALTIIRKYVAPGEHFESVVARIPAGDVPTNAVGGGTLVDVFNAAADSWEGVIKDEHTVIIQFGWYPIPVGSGVHSVLSQRGDPNRVTDAIVYFDNDGSTEWFLDPTPYEHSEYQTSIECYGDIGARRVNSGRVRAGGRGPAKALDLLTIAKHEAGHSLGLTTWNRLWGSKHADDGIRLNAPRPFSGALIPVNTGAHLLLNGALMDPSLIPGQRKLLSAVDVLAIAEMGEFVALVLNPDGHASAKPLPGRVGMDPGC